MAEKKRILDVSNLYRRFIKDCANVATPLNDMFKKDNGVNWGSEVDQK